MPETKIGIFTDLHYCDCDHDLENNRYHRNSLKKLEQIIQHFNKEKLDFQVNLGDTVDKNLESFAAVTERFSRLKAPLYTLQGNHDYDVKPEEKKSVESRLGIEKSYHYFDLNHFRFCFLNGSEISTFANPEGSENYNLAVEKLKELAAQNEVNLNDWNGGIGKTQLEWFRKTVVEAGEKNLAVVVFCHYPVFPMGKHSLLNYPEILQIIKSHPHLKAWFCGHNHAGNYGLFNHCHIVNFQGVVDTPEENAFCILTINPQEIKVKAYGREIDRELKI